MRNSSAHQHTPNQNIFMKKNSCEDHKYFVALEEVQHVAIPNFQSGAKYQVKQLSKGLNAKLPKEECKNQTKENILLGPNKNVHPQNDQRDQEQNLRKSLHERKSPDKYGYEPTDFRYFVLYLH